MKELPSVQNEISCLIKEHLENWWRKTLNESPNIELRDFTQQFFEKIALYNNIVNPLAPPKDNQAMA